MSVIPLHGTWKRGDKLFKVIIWLHSKYEASLGYMSPKCRQFPEGLRLKLRTKPYTSCSVEDGECIPEEEMVCAKARGKRQTNSFKEKKQWNLEF